MSDLLRRLRERGTAPREESVFPRERLKAIDSYSIERSTSVEPAREEQALRREPKLTTAADLGEHVAAVVATAEQAAEQMQSEAAADAERIRAEAREEAKALIAEATREAERIREGATTYSSEARQDADAYAGEKRSEADAYSHRVRAEVEQDAREVRAAAEQEAKGIERDARRRREILSSELERFEERVHSLHTVFQGMTTQLETLLPTNAKTSGEEPRAADSIEESLRPEGSKHVSA
jgi:hypothetical protein